MNKKFLIGMGVLALIFLVVVLLPSPSAADYENINAVESEIEIYKSATCGCCGIYTSYFDGKTSPDIESLNVQDTYSIKREHGVPPELESCHTTLIDGYFVEGHIPLEAIEKLLSEKPDVAGIAMPGMPSGSPGMPGPKRGDFVIYSVNHDGSYQEFMRI